MTGFGVSGIEPSGSAIRLLELISVEVIRGAVAGHLHGSNMFQIMILTNTFSDTTVCLLT
jgi:hypothetical protein